MDLLSADKYSLCCAERANWPAMKMEKRENTKDEIWDWAYPKLEVSTDYFMLLCREKNDYTVFECTNKYNGIDVLATSFVKEVAEVLDSRGHWIAADYDEDNDAWQLWVNLGGVANAYILFDARGFVIPC